MRNREVIIANGTFSVERSERDCESSIATKFSGSVDYGSSGPHFLGYTYINKYIWKKIYIYILYIYFATLHDEIWGIIKKNEAKNYQRIGFLMPRWECEGRKSRSSVFIAAPREGHIRDTEFFSHLPRDRLRICWTNHYMHDIFREEIN